MLSRFGGRRHKQPLLKVVGGPQAGKPKRLSHWVYAEHKITIECWTEAEWDRLPEAKRPGSFAHLPGFGYLAMRQTVD
jgi:hypothetical protein